MDDKMQEAVKKFDCSICGLLLSVGPVMVARDDHGKTHNKCGRCYRINLKKYRWVRNFLFEEMAQNLHFPCSYPPCAETLSWGKVQEHEGSCRHKTIKCPLSEECGCSDEMLVDLFGEHAANKHKDIVRITNTVGNEWQVNAGDSYTFFVELDNQYFFVYIKEWQEITVAATRWSKYTKFKVGLKFQAKDKYAATVTDLPVIPYNNNISAHSFMNNILNSVTKVFESCYTVEYGRNGRYVVRNQNISIRITFIADETKDPGLSLKEDEGPEQIPLRLNLEALKKALICPYCMTYMAAPILSCDKGHTICSGCKSRLERCPTCQASLDGARIYTLEAMAEDVELPCQFKSSGCSFAGNTSTLLTHELECPSRDLSKDE